MTFYPLPPAALNGNPNPHDDIHPKSMNEPREIPAANAARARDLAARDNGLADVTPPVHVLAAQHCGLG